MNHCVRCLYPANHALGITFDDEGVCSGCRVHEEKDILDWTEREQKLRELVDSYRSRTRTIHDCIVPVSGARDSLFIVDYVKNKLGLNPLLVTYNKHYNTPEGVENLAYLRSLIGADIMTMTVSPDRVKAVTRATLKLVGSMYWHCIAGQTAFPVQIAVKFKIPLIIWGAHQGLDQVGMFSHLDEVEMTRKYRKEHDLMGYEAEDLLKCSPELSERLVTQYVYPHDKEIEAVGVRGIYLGNYLRWDSLDQHEKMQRQYRVRSASQYRTFDQFNDVDCFHYSGLHDLIKYFKFGYSKINDHVAREIRLKKMSLEQGYSLIQSFREKRAKDIPLFLDWIGLSEFDLFSMLNSFRDKTVWAKDSNGDWFLRSDCFDKTLISPAHEAARLVPRDFAGRYHSYTPAEPPNDSKEKYILFGRGWVDE